MTVTRYQGWGNFKKNILFFSDMKLEIRKYYSALNNEETQINKSRTMSGGSNSEQWNLYSGDTLGTKESVSWMKAGLGFVNN